MSERERQYLCIDLKSFYASVECVDRGLDPMTTRLVVADLTRTEKTICLAVSPAMKALGVRNRCRVFEIPKTIDHITAPPRMARYIERSADIYSIYLKYLSPDDIQTDAPLFGEGLGLDSIDALELGMAVKKAFGVTFSPNATDNKRIFYSVKTLADHVESQQGAAQ